jgi:hypothetical protein
MGVEDSAFFSLSFGTGSRITCIHFAEAFTQSFIRTHSQFSASDNQGTGFKYLVHEEVCGLHDPEDESTVIPKHVRHYLPTGTLSHPRILIFLDI